MCDPITVAEAEAEAAGAPDEIEITPAMIDAGVSVLCELETETAGETYWADKIYRAMHSVRMN